MALEIPCISGFRRFQVNAIGELLFGKLTCGPEKRVTRSTLRVLLIAVINEGTRDPAGSWFLAYTIRVITALGRRLALVANNLRTDLGIHAQLIGACLSCCQLTAWAYWQTQPDAGAPDGAHIASTQSLYLSVWSPRWPINLATSSAIRAYCWWQRLL